MIDLGKLTDKEILYFDGAMGTMLQQRGLTPGELPELLNLSHPDIVTGIHRDYVKAGSDVITTNTFQANELKLGGHNVEAIIEAGVRCAKASGARFVALDIGPLGQLMEPAGTVAFERAYDIYRRQVIAGTAAGADIIIFETISDPYEMKAALLAAKENCALPVICSMTFQEDGRTFLGCDALTAALILQGLGADALGVNCSLGPKTLMPVVETMLKYSRVPIIVQANAGLPVMRGESAAYELGPEEYAEQVMEIAEKGVKILGGCCGTTPDYIYLLKERTRGVTPVFMNPVRVTACSSGTKTVIIDGTVEIGERLNPTGKEKMKNALRTGNTGYIIGEAIAQVDAGSQVLDVNAGLPDIDEPAALSSVIRAVQGVLASPLQIDSASSGAIEAGARIYNGIPIINSVNGKKEVMDSIFPLVKKYGALVIALTLDENGIPETAQGRLEIARRIRDTAQKYGIPEENIIIDCLVLTASAQQSLVKETLEAIKLVKSELGLKTVLGVSNVSFGLPDRETINATFLAAALGAGLDCAIVNPLSAASRSVLDVYRVLSNEDENAARYIALRTKKTEKESERTPERADLKLSEIIEQGRKDEAAEKVKELLEKLQPLDIIDNEFIPALNRVGKRFETGEIFLPQLMLSAQAVQEGFEALRGCVSESQRREAKGKVLLATVQGDIHDIGKNIVKMLLESYGYEVVDLGKDVPAEAVVNAIREQGVKIAGLSALMTTTVKGMKDTIEAVRSAGLDCAFIVGGAVLSEEYAKYVGADYYSKDAMEGVSIVNRFFGDKRG